MASDNTAIGLGIPSLILIIITWLTAGSRWGCSSYPCYPWVFTNPGGLLVLIGSLLFIPVFILTIIFITAQNSSCENVAFGFGLTGWFLVIIGALVGLYYTVSNYLTPALLILFICPQIILGFGLFARRNFGVNVIRSPTQGPYGMYPTRPPVQGRNIPRGRVVVPEEVRMAGTYGQSVKRCVQCGNTIDIKTMVCYFCGARQSGEPVNPLPQRPLPVTAAHSAHQAPPRGAATSEYAFCPGCGTKVFRGHLFCTQCGASLEI